MSNRSLAWTGFILPSAKWTMGLKVPCLSAHLASGVPYIYSSGVNFTKNYTLLYLFLHLLYALFLLMGPSGGDRKIINRMNRSHLSIFVALVLKYYETRASRAHGIDAHACMQCIAMRSDDLDSARCLVSATGDISFHN